MSVCERKGERKIYSVTSMRMEYDLLLLGIQKSHLSDIDPRISDVTNEQKNGFGFKMSIENIFYYDNINIGPRFSTDIWLIGDSEMAEILYNGVPIGYAIEPENVSLEVTLGLVIGF